MTTVGLTGNAASGKTTVADRWRERGALVIDADRLGHEVLREDAAARAALVGAFGRDIVAPDGSLDRAELGRRAFVTPEAVRRLDAIVHPPLLARLDEELAAARRAGRDLVVVDAALIFEFGLDNDLDILVLVTAPREVRAERLRARGLKDERVEQLMASQAPDAGKAAACDFVIVNDGSVEDLLTEAEQVLDAILERTAKRGGRDG